MGNADLMAEKMIKNMSVAFVTFFKGKCRISDILLKIIFSVA